jgi:helicase
MIESREVEHLKLLENSAAAMSRSIAAAPMDWGHLIAAAQRTIGLYQESHDNQRLIDDLLFEEKAHPLIAAARILEAAARCVQVESSEESTNLFLLSAAAFAMHGNFVSARAILASPSIRLEGRDGLTWAAIATFCPSQLPIVLRSIERQTHESDYIEKLSYFLRTGDYNGISSLRESLKTCMARASDAVAIVLLRCARIALQQLLNLSVSFVLKEFSSTIGSDTIGRLVDGGISTLLPPQRRALESSPILRSNKNVLITFPTSTGKTLLAELMVAAALHNQDGVAVYLAPYIALASQVSKSLRAHLPESIRVSVLAGGLPLSSDDNFLAGRTVIVATPERFDLLIRSEKLPISMLRLVVADEVHMVERDERGARLEGILSRMRLLQTQGMNFRIAALSAVVSNFESICTWLNIEADAVVTDKWRPTARRVGVWTASGNLVWLHGTDPMRPSNANLSTQLGKRTLIPNRPIYPTDKPGGIRHQQQAAYENGAQLARQLSAEIGSPILIVCMTKPSTRKLAEAIAAGRPEPALGDITPKQDDLVARILDAYQYLRPLAEMIKKRVAYHNSTIPPEIRSGIEDAVRSRDLDCVVATTTLAEGVDLPFRSTIMFEWLIGYKNDQHPVSPLLFRNIAGRCGRAGSYSEGDTIIYENQLGNLEYTADPRVRANAILGMISKEPILESAVERAELSPARQRISAVLEGQFIAAIPENPNSEDLVGDLVGHMFSSRMPANTNAKLILTNARTAALDETYGALARAASPIRLTELGVAVNETGLSPESCFKIMSKLPEVPQGLTLVQAVTYVMRSFYGLREQTNRTLIDVVIKNGSRKLITPADFEGIAEKYLARVPLQRIFAELPKAAKSTTAAKVSAWAQGQAKSDHWDAQFDGFVEFSAQVLDGFVPTILRACGILAQHCRCKVPKENWQAFAEIVVSVSRDPTSQETTETDV